MDENNVKISICWPKVWVRTLRFSLIYTGIFAGLIAISLSGCRQPAARQSDNRPALFDFTGRKSSGQSRFARNDLRGSNSRGFDAQIPDLDINDGSQLADTANRVETLNQKIGEFDDDNQLLNTEVATLKQKLQLANQYNQSLKDQLAGTTGQVQQTFAQRQAATQQIAALQAQLQQANRSLEQDRQNGSSAGQLAGYNGAGQTQLASTRGATLRANNSLLQKLSAIQIPGGQARMDGDVIRIEFPSDRMFVPGTYQVQPAQNPVLQNIVRTIRDAFPRQIVGIEAHWDNTPLSPPGTTDHQLTATQSLAVFEQLVQLGLPRNQLFTMAMASNRPRHPNQIQNGISPNRRVELVIYPETYDGS